MNKEKTEKEWIEIYNEQKDFISTLLYKGEKMVQCLDKKSFKGRYYYPQWVATSYGRVYSLAHKRFLKIKPKGTGRKSKNGEYPNEYYYIGGKISAHKLTANYFCNKTLVKIFGEKYVIVHHKKAFNTEKGLIENNRADNLCYVIKITHSDVIHQWMKGKTKIDVDKCIESILPILADSEDSYIEAYVNEEGKEGLKIHFNVDDPTIIFNGDKFIDNIHIDMPIKIEIPGNQILASLLKPEIQEYIDKYGINSFKGKEWTAVIVDKPNEYYKVYLDDINCVHCENMNSSGIHKPNIYVGKDYVGIDFE